MVDLDQAALNLFTLALQAAHDLRIPGDFEVRLSVEPAQSRFRHAGDRPGAFRPFGEQGLVPPFRPLEGAFLLSEGLDVALDSLTELASDAVSQAGANSLLNAQGLKWQSTLLTSESRLAPERRQERETELPLER